MTDTVIKVENLSKKYTIRHQQRESYTALRDVMATGAKRLGAKLLSPFIARPSSYELPATSSQLPASTHESRATSLELSASSSMEDFWALKDVSFEVKQGEVVGIIGRNGAGKSTLLKILSRITEPTTGSVKIKGRVASLLEVGTGFHPELTGRENVYLNGAILGMTKAEIKRKFDEIVAFAEIEKFLDTPVKRYSSGMYVRLAFAVAAHLEPEILVVDEVLAVGDAAFQKKCLGKMKDVAKEGRTVLLVSHNLITVDGLCTRVILLEKGTISFYGSAHEGILMYEKNIANSVSEDLLTLKDRSGNGRLRLTGYSLLNEDGQMIDTAAPGKCLILKIRYEAAESVSKVNVAFNLYENENYVLMNFNTSDVGKEFSKLGKRGEFLCKIPYFPLREGVYFGNLFCTEGSDIADWVRPGIKIQVKDRDVYGTGRLNAQGKIVTSYDWEINSEVDDK